MPIRFHCQRCHRLLGIASRKAGSEIQCPKCGISQVVPGEEAAAAALAMTRFARTREAAESVSSLVVYDDEPAAIETARPMAAEKTGPAAPIHDAAGAMARHRIEADRPVPGGMILFPRRTIYIQGLLLLVVAVAAFGSGYLIGRGDANYQSRIKEENAHREQVPIQGKLVYNPGTGQVVGDAGAVIIALPDGKLPKKTLSIQDIRPQDPPPDDSDHSVQMIAQLGGAYARADASGGFFLVVPDRGAYHLLIISSHAARPKGTDIDEVDLSELEAYFSQAKHLIGRYKYRWTTEDVDSSFNPIELHFGRDGQK